jgi:hypothetical protein
MEKFCQAMASKYRKRDLHVHIKEMHTHMREIELKEEEELQQCKEALKKLEE